MSRRSRGVGIGPSAGRAGSCCGGTNEDAPSTAEAKFGGSCRDLHVDYSVWPRGWIEGVVSSRDDDGWQCLECIALLRSDLRIFVRYAARTIIDPTQPLRNYLYGVRNTVRTHTSTGNGPRSTLSHDIQNNIHYIRCESPRYVYHTVPIQVFEPRRPMHRYSRS
jgi:hypothetical protein